MSELERLDMIDMIISSLMDHEKKLDQIVRRLENIEAIKNRKIER